MNELISVNQLKIENMIHEVREKQVILDRDLAILYKTEKRIINQAVKRNIDRFPNEFCFQLNQEEFLNWKSQNVMSNSDRRGLRRLPFAFTEQGVAMLSVLIKSDIAINVSISIMNAFVHMRKYVSNNLLEQKYINNQVIKNTEDIKLLQESFSRFEKKRKINEIYFNGQIYDAYSKIKDIFVQADEELIIIDGYSDKTTLDMIKLLRCNVVLVIKKNGLLTKLDIEKYNKQYNNLRVIYDNTYHDRYFILDKKIYHCGASVNYVGSKTFSVNKLEDDDVIKNLLNNINTII